MQQEEEDAPASAGTAAAAGGDGTHLEVKVFMSSETLYKSAPQYSQLLYIVISSECRKRLGLTQNAVVEAGLHAECAKWEMRHMLDAGPLICKTCNPTKCVVTVTQCASIEECNEPVDYSNVDCMVPTDVQARLSTPDSDLSSIDERYQFRTRIFCTSSRDHLFGNVVMRVTLLPDLHVWSHQFVLRSRNTQTQSALSKRISTKKADASEVIMFWRPNVSIGRRKVASAPARVKQELGQPQALSPTTTGSRRRRQQTDFEQQSPPAAKRTTLRASISNSGEEGDGSDTGDDDPTVSEGDAIAKQPEGSTTFSPMIVTPRATQLLLPPLSQPLPSTPQTAGKVTSVVFWASTLAQG
eukprot:TRINITY_DN2720_c0_g1_i1.p1 TRINITY_DN2720_c0_g1~~TRINITY_DN2720_c0_g1_i1.p1  ORF type:complete len:355 (-),score=70.27 TRINITY_DN2720_c0_g1_i1:489-1553(-)